MDITRAFFDYLNKFINISDQEYQQYILPYIKVRRFGKKEVISKANEVEDYFNFILRGMVRKYYRKGKEEINTQISYENHIIHSQESFHSRKPSEYYVEAIEPTTMVSISYDDLERIYDSSKKMEHLGRLIITHTMIVKDRWQIQLIKHSPRERFIHFVNKNPELLQRVPQKFLASYLNIKPETFSRFKHLVRTRIKAGDSVSDD